MPERVHHSLLQAFRTGGVKLVAPVIKVEEEAHEVGANAELLRLAFRVAHPAQQTCIQTDELVQLFLRELPILDDERVGLSGCKASVRIETNGEWDRLHEVRESDDLPALRFRLRRRRRFRWWRKGDTT